MKNKVLHKVAITAIIIKYDKYLITRRAPEKEPFAGQWTVPGGKLETDDYIDLPKDTAHHWYNILEKVLRREVREEVGLEIENIDYVTSLAMVHDDGAPSLIISAMADWSEGEVTLQEDEADKYAWVSTEEAAEYDLIDGIYDELVMTDKQRQGVKEDWSRAT